MVCGLSRFSEMQLRPFALKPVGCAPAVFATGLSYESCGLGQSEDPHDLSSITEGASRLAFHGGVAVAESMPPPGFTDSVTATAPKTMTIDLVRYPTRSGFQIHRKLDRRFRSPQSAQCLAADFGTRE